MSFIEFLPKTEWQDYIAAYWVRNTKTDASSSGRRIYADGCIDLICNAGNNVAYFYPKAVEKQAIPLHPGQLYLGGTMTTYGVLKSDGACSFTGIRFWPGGFYGMFARSAEQLVDTLIEFPDDELCLLMRNQKELAVKLDGWLAARLAAKRMHGSNKYDFLFLRNLMYDSGGQASVKELAEGMCVSKRTLERIFKLNVGIPPKKFLQIIRFQKVLKRLRSYAGKKEAFVTARESLLEIAFELGYFDHAHLISDFKKYAGVLPSELSHFYKTGSNGGKYF